MFRHVFLPVSPKVSQAHRAEVAEGLQRLLQPWLGSPSDQSWMTRTTRTSYRNQRGFYLGQLAKCVSMRGKVVIMTYRYYRVHDLGHHLV
jgi:hypothetical protein